MNTGWAEGDVSLWRSPSGTGKRLGRVLLNGNQLLDRDVLCAQPFRFCNTHLLLCYCHNTVTHNLLLIFLASQFQHSLKVFMSSPSSIFAIKSILSFSHYQTYFIIRYKISQRRVIGFRSNGNKTTGIGYFTTISQEMYHYRSQVEI